MEKLYSKRSALPAITHVDFSARVQTVAKNDNPLYWKLHKAFANLSDFPVLVNTSFNVRGEPIVCTPENAINCFRNTEMDVLVIGGFIVEKQQKAEGE